MRQIVFHDAEGRIVRVVASEANPPERFGTEAHLIVAAERLIDAHAFRVVDGGLQERLEMPSLVIPAAAPSVIDLSVLPEGTTVRVTNALGDVLIVADLGEPLTLTDPGFYEMRLAPPFPWRASSFSVEIEDHA